MLGVANRPDSTCSAMKLSVQRHFECLHICLTGAAPLHCALLVHTANATKVDSNLNCLTFIDRHKLRAQINEFAPMQPTHTKIAA